MSVTVTVDNDNISDGFHTFQDLYDFQHILFINLMTQYRKYAWKSLAVTNMQREDFFWGCIDIPNVGTVAVRIPVEYWDKIAADISTIQYGVKYSDCINKEVLMKLCKITGENMHWNKESDNG